MLFKWFGAVEALPEMQYSDNDGDSTFSEKVLVVTAKDGMQVMVRYLDEGFPAYWEAVCGHGNGIFNDSDILYWRNLEPWFLEIIDSFSDWLLLFK